MKTIFALDAVARDVVREHLKNIKNAHITTDAWSDIGARGFGSLSVTYIDEDWNIKSMPASVEMIKVIIVFAARTPRCSRLVLLRDFSTTNKFDHFMCWHFI